MPLSQWLTLLRRRIVPRTLLWRAMLIIVLPLVVLQIILTVIFYNRHWDTITRWLAAGVAGEVALTIELLEAAPDAAARRELLDRIRRHTDLAISFEPGGSLAAGLAQLGRNATARSRIDEKIIEAFKEKLNRPFAIDLRSDWPMRVVVYVQLDDGLLRVLAPRKRVTSTTTGTLLAWMIGASLVLIAVAIYYMRLQIVPIRQLVRAMDSFGKGRDIGDFPPRGPLEIRKAAHAFNAMRRRILQFVSQRTEMLAAISHDLRTPLTRMKLQLEMLSPKGDPEIANLMQDIEEMRHLIDVYLEFARGEGGEQVSEVDLAAMLRAECARLPQNGVRIELRTPRTLVAPVRPIALRRCLRNLLDNAIRYGEKVLVIADRRQDMFEIRIEDDGPGIPPEERERVFQPFYRADRARRSQTGGAGLGLAIARDIVLAHGGQIALRDSALGGLAVVIRLPS